MYRVEDKYFCSEKEMFILESRLKTVMKSDQNSQGLPYRITSLYFDDYKDACLLDSEDGVSHRKKYRIRIYNGSINVIKLEVKYKAFNRVFKKSQSISIDDAKALISGKYIEDETKSIDNPVTLFNLAIKQDLLKPKVIVDYTRSAYIYAPGNVRITFDRNIRASNKIQSFLIGGYDYLSIRNNEDKVLEIKYDEFLPGFIGRLLESGNMIQTSYSKYKLCREQMGG